MYNSIIRLISSRNFQVFREYGRLSDASLGKGHQTCADIMNVELQMSNRSAIVCNCVQLR